jgi:hypothetical protein
LIAAVVLSAIPVLAFAQAGGMVMNRSDKERGVEAADSITHITEDVGIFAIGASLGLLILPLINIRNTNANPNQTAGKNIFISIAALTMAAGVIHILLVKEHM